MWADYTWIVVVGSLAAFFTAFGIGANDVANAFGSSVAAKTLTMRQALLIASVCEFGGSVLLGAEVTRTVSGGIARILVFETEPEIYMYGMLCVLAASGTWLLLATYLSLPVSTTHATIGGVLGFTFVYGGSHAVLWLEPQDTFPYMGGLVPIILAWFTSPLLSGLATVILFVIVRSAILRRVRSLELAIWALPVLVLLTVFINLFFVLYTGAGARLVWRSGKAAWVSAVAAGGCALLTALVGVPYMRHRVRAAAEARSQQSQSRAEFAGSRPSLPSEQTTPTFPRFSAARYSHGAAAAAAAGTSRGGGGGGGGSIGTLATRGTDATAGAGALVRGHPGTGSGIRGGGFGGTRSFSRSTARFSEGPPSQPSRQGSGAAELALAALQPQQPHQAHRGFQPPEGIPESAAPAAPGPAVISPVVPLASGGAPSGNPADMIPHAESEAALHAAQPAQLQLRHNDCRKPPSEGQLQQQQQAMRHNGEEEQQQPQLQLQEALQFDPAEQMPQPQGNEHRQAVAPPHVGVLNPLEKRGDGAGAGGVGYNTIVAAIPGLTPPAGVEQPQQQQQQEWQLHLQGHQNQQQSSCWPHQLQQQQPGALHQQQQQAHLALHPGGLWQQHQPGQLQGQPQPQQQYWSQQQHHQGLQWQQHQHQGAWQQQTQQQLLQHQVGQPQHQQAATGGYYPHAADLARQQWQQQQQQQQLLLLQQQQMWNLQAQVDTWQAQSHQQQQQLQQQQQRTWLNQEQQQTSWQQQQQVLQNSFQREHLDTMPGGGEMADSGAAGSEGTRLGAAANTGGTTDRSTEDAAAGRARPGPVGESAEGEWEREQRTRSFGDRRGEYGGGVAAAAPQNVPANAAVPCGYESSDDTEGGETPPEQPQNQHEHGSNNAHFQKTFEQLKAIVLHGTDVNVHACVELGEDPVAAAIHAHAEVFDPSTEHAFKYLQVVTAICDSFSHGANDVANSVGPLAAIWYTYRYQRVDFDSSVPIWILVLGGAGIVVGLGTYGYNIIRAIGLRLSAVTPSRGFCIELSTALVVVLASMYGLPISTTHCQVGATAGIGLLEGSAGLNWRLASQFFAGWLVTLLFSALMSAALFAAGAYAPCIQQGRAISAYEMQLATMTTRLDLLLNRTNTAALADPVTWGNYSAPLHSQLEADLLAVQLATTPGSADATRPVQHVPAGVVLEFISRTLDMYLNNSMPYIGGMHAQGQALPRMP